jgi:hypothetical protein
MVTKKFCKIEKSFIKWRVLPQVKINTRILDTPCIQIITMNKVSKLLLMGV